MKREIGHTDPPFWPGTLPQNAPPAAMNLNNFSQGGGGASASASNIPAKYGSVQSSTNSTHSFSYNHSYGAGAHSNSPSKSALHGLAISSHPSSQQPSPAYSADTGRRPSANVSRISFLYNNSFMGHGAGGASGAGGSSGSGDITSTSNSLSNIPASAHPPLLRLNSVPERSRFQAANEILACDRSWETPNLVAIATPRNLQLLKVSNSDISLETDLSMKPPGRTKIGTISDLAFGHQQYGRYVAASTITGSIHLYNLDRGARMKNTLSGHQRAVNSISFNTIAPHLLASGSQDGKILIWDLKASNSKPSLSLYCNADAVRCNSFSPKKANVLAAVFDSGVVEKWDLRKTNTWEKRINAHTGPALSVHWHPELDYIVTGGRDKQLQVWNMGSNADCREPSHVINTSGPIYKAKWCKGRGNGSIMNTDIAVSFFNDDPCVQIWNLNRKYIPKAIISGHSAPITHIVWRTPKNLISCSKDKLLIQYDVTKEPNFIDKIPTGAFAWNPSEKNDFVFIKQKKSQFEGPFTHTRPTQLGELNTVEEVDLVTNSSTSTNMSAQSSMIATAPENGMQMYEMVSTSPGGHSPTLASSLKLQRQQPPTRQPSFMKPVPKCLPPPAWVTPVHVPLPSNNTEKFKFLSTHYMIKVPEGSDITEVCEYNSMLAASVGYFRDSQTWKTIKVAILLEFEEKNDAEIESKLHQFEFRKIDQLSRSDSRLGTSYGSESDIMKRVGSELSGSYISEVISTNDKPTTEANLVKYDESAIIDDEDEDIEEKEREEEQDEKDNQKEQENQKEKQAKEREHEQKQVQEDKLRLEKKENSFDGKLLESEMLVEDDDKKADKNDTIIISSAKNSHNGIGDSTINLDGKPNEQSKIGVPNGSVETANSFKQHQENRPLLPSQISPIEIEAKIRRQRGESMARQYRYSFTGSSVDMDDEKSGSPMSLSCSPLIHKSRSKLMMSLKNSGSEEVSLNIGKSVETRFSRISDSKSQLTAILKESNKMTNLTSGAGNSSDPHPSRENSTNQYHTHDKLTVPWNPADLIKYASQYSADQGDVLMCATLALLFEQLYPSSVTFEKAEEWIYLYHEYLLRCGYFSNAATVLRIASETHDCFTKVGQTKTSVRLLCCHCGKPLLNDESKESFNNRALKQSKGEDLEMHKNDFGFWYCDKCRKLQGGCCYCAEPIKGNTVALVGCGHEGHFGCFRTWFVDQGESECPACGALCVK